MYIQEVILQVGADGGSISLLGTRNPAGTWRFTSETNESFHADLLSEEEREGLSFDSRDGSVGTFPEAVNLLKKYPWYRLYPLKVHPEFRQSVFDAVIELTKADGVENRNLYEWKIECGIPLD